MLIINKKEAMPRIFKTICAPKKIGIDA